MLLADADADADADGDADADADAAARSGSLTAAAGGSPVQCHLVAIAELARYRTDDLEDRHGSHRPDAYRYADPTRRVVAVAGRLLLGAVFARATAGSRQPDLALVVDPAGRPAPAGKRPAGACAGLAHDGGLLVVGYHPQGCAVDVEDVDAALLVEAASRFCTPAELRGRVDGASLRAAWSAKESVAKYRARGLRAGLRNVTFEGDPARGWVRARRTGAELGPMCRVFDAEARHVAFAVGTSVPPAVEVRHWSPVRVAPGARGVRLVESPLPRGGPVREVACAVRSARGALTASSSTVSRQEFI